MNACRRRFDPAEVLAIFRSATRLRIGAWHGHRVGHGVGQMTLLGRHEAFLLAALVLRDGRSDVQGDHPGITI